MKSQTAKARAILYSNFNDGCVHDKNEFLSLITRKLNTTQEWAEKWLDLFALNLEIIWTTFGKFIVTGSPNQLTLKDV